MSFGVQGSTDAANLVGQQQQQGSTQNLRPFANLDLSEDQRTQIRQIMSDARSQGLSESQVQTQINAVLTPQQQQTLQQDVQTAQSSGSGHHHHHSHGSGGPSSIISPISGESSS